MTELGKVWGRAGAPMGMPESPSGHGVRWMGSLSITLAIYTCNGSPTSALS